MNELEIDFRNFFNRLKWDPDFAGKAHEFEITYTHRGAPDDILSVNYSEISKIKSDGFIYFNEWTELEVFIPYHRIEKIENFITNEVYFPKEEEPNI